MIRAWLAAAAVLGFLSVGAGAIGAHLAAEGRALELLRTGALYGMAHAAALIAVAARARALEQAGFALPIAGWAFTVGTLLFSLSLFALALTGIEGFSSVTPFGGAALLIGWAALGAHALRRR